MSKFKKLITEIHHRSLWQVLLIYIGAGWVVFQSFLSEWSASNTTGLTRGLAMGAHTANSFCSIPLLGVVDYRRVPPAVPWC